MAGWNGMSFKILPIPCTGDLLQAIVVIGSATIPRNLHNFRQEVMHPSQSTIPKLPLLGKFPVENDPSL